MCIKVGLSVKSKGKSSGIYLWYVPFKNIVRLTWNNSGNKPVSITVRQIVHNDVLITSNFAE